MRVLPLLVALPVAGACSAAVSAAEPIQRCETASGAVTYSNGPCPAGTKPVRHVDTSPPVSVADRQAARDRARRDAQQLERLERDRRAERLAAEKARIAAAQKEERRARECRKLAASVDEARDALSRATLAQRTAAERRLARAQDRYARDCGN